MRRLHVFEVLNVLLKIPFLLHIGKVSLQLSEAREPLRECEAFPDFFVKELVSWRIAVDASTGVLGISILIIHMFSETYTGSNAWIAMLASILHFANFALFSLPHSSRSRSSFKYLRTQAQITKPRFPVSVRTDSFPSYSTYFGSIVYPPNPAPIRTASYSGFSATEPMFGYSVGRAMRGRG